jgi:hypothetical protein
MVALQERASTRSAGMEGLLAPGYKLKPETPPIAARRLPLV